MILVDSSVWIDYFNGVDSPEAARLDALLARDFVVIGDLILTEVLQGFSRNGDFEQAKALLGLLPLKEMLGRDIAIQSAANYRALRRRGATVRKTIDVIIGTFCIENRLPLLHRDRDFDLLERHLGLAVVRAS